jgi:hypothetical protein
MSRANSRNAREGQMSLGMNILGFGAHSGAWRSAEVPANAYLDVEYYRNIARISERGCLDAIFLADGPALGADVSTQPAGRLEPTVLLTAVALATQRRDCDSVEHLQRPFQHRPAFRLAGPHQRGAGGMERGDQRR